MAELTAKSLILDMASAVAGVPMPVQALVRSAALFGIKENNVRVALARLFAQGLLERNERGQYLLSPAAKAVGGHVASWPLIGQRMVSWRGAWVAAYTAGLRRSDRKGLRRRRRALELLGLRELERGLWLRPDNLRGSISAVRGQLVELGLDEAVLVVGLSDLDAGASDRARRLWDVEALDEGYRGLRAKLVDSARCLEDATVERILIEVFVLGGEALRHLAFDPLLPPAILAPAERDALIAELSAYHKMGWSSWRRFMRGLGAPVSSLPVNLRAFDTRIAQGCHEQIATTVVA